MWVVIVPRKDCTTVLYHCTVSVLLDHVRVGGTVPS